LEGCVQKCTVVDDDGRLSIGKFPSVNDERSVTKGEVLALRLAAGAASTQLRRNWSTATARRLLSSVDLIDRMAVVD
jgi:serine/threonine-protein kinase HipA